jgi:hypothetical protein
MFKIIKRGIRISANKLHANKLHGNKYIPIKKKEMMTKQIAVIHENLYTMHKNIIVIHNTIKDALFLSFACGMVIFSFSSGSLLVYLTFH